MSWDHVRVYGAEVDGADGAEPTTTPGTESLAIVTYGNGVVTALRAAKTLRRGSGNGGGGIDVSVIDCPYISGVPDRLKDVVQGYSKVLFADVCKEGLSCCRPSPVGRGGRGRSAAGT